MGISLLNDVGVTGALTIQDSLSSPDPLLTLYNDTNGNGCTILFSDQATTQAQKGRLTFYHSDSSSHGGGASFKLTSTEDDLVLAVGDADATHGRIVVWSGGSSAEVDYGFAQDINTGMRRLGADNVGLVGGGETGVSVTGTATSLRYAGSTKLATTNTGLDITGGIEVSGAASRFSNSVRFTANATFDNNSKAMFGDDDDLQIYHDGTDSYIDDAGTGDLRIRSNFLKVEKYTGETMATFNDDNAVTLYYDNNIKLATDAKGIAVTGDVLDRDIPCILTSHFSDDGSTTSYLFMPFNNNSESSSNQYYNYFAAPAAGKVVSIMLMHVSGSMSSSFTTQLRVTKNGQTANTSGELTPSNGTSDGSYVEYTPGTTFAKGDRLQFSYQKSAGSKYWRGATATIVIELTDYDI